MKTVLIIGMGRFGRHLAKKMDELGNEVMIVDSNPEMVEQVASDFSDAHIGDCTNEGVIRSLGVANFDICFVTIGEDFQSSLVITSLLKKLGAKYVVAKARYDIQAEILSKIGADEIVYPEREMAEKLAIRYNAENIFDFIQLTSEYSIYEIPILSEWINQTLSSLGIRTKYGINIIAVKNKDNTLLPTPSADYEFQRGDHIVVIGKSSDVFKLSAMA